MARIVLVSADAHAAAKLESYRPYLESRYHEALDRQIAADQEVLRLIPMRSAVEDRDLQEAEVVDELGAIRGGGAAGAHDAKRRVEEMDREGVACEIVNANTTDSQEFCVKPFCWTGSAPWPAEHRQAGAIAFNRWLADHMAETDGRVLGVAESGTCLDIDEAVANLEWAAEHGFVSVHAPRQIVDPALPPIYHETYYEKFWAACVDLGIVLNVHAGWSLPQQNLAGALPASMATDFDAFRSAIGKVMFDNVDSHLIRSLSPEEMGPLARASAQSRQAMWWLMIGGVFDRHPNLKLTITELRADWVPATLGALDERFAKGDTPMQLKPSEYFRRNIHVTPSFQHPVELEMRHEIGVEQTMFGRDYPHPEGTWPNTLDWIRAAYAGVPEDEARLMLGENAIEWYGLDRAKLTAIAEKIGPRPEDILGEHAVDPLKIQNFDFRGGYAKPAEKVNTDAVLRAFEADLADARAMA